MRISDWSSDVCSSDLMHHSLVDGIGGMRMLARMMSLDAKSRDQQPPWAVGAQQRKAKTGERTTPLQAALDGMRTQLKTIPGVARAFGDIVREDVRQEEKDWALPFTGPRSAFNGNVSGQRRLATQTYSLHSYSSDEPRAGNKL